MSGIIPKEESSRFKRWQIGSFDSPRPVAPPQATSAPAVVEVQETAAEVSLPTADDIERMYEEARISGYQAGLEEGRQAAEQAAREAAEEERQHFLALTGNLHKALTELDQDVAEQLLALATEIAAQVICGSIALKADLLLPIIREAIAALPLHHTHITLRLNPVDATKVREQLGEHLAQSNTQIVADTEISPGGCQVRTGASEVDATIETRWRRVIEAIGATPQAWLNP